LVRFICTIIRISNTAFYVPILPDGSGATVNGHPNALTGVRSGATVGCKDIAARIEKIEARQHQTDSVIEVLVDEIDGVHLWEYFPSLRSARFTIDNVFYR
jgi:hypothetical protein